MRSVNVSRTKERDKSGFIVFILLTMAVMLFNPVPAAGEEGSGGAGGEKYSFHVGGYVRTWASVNLHDIPGTEGYNDRYKASMLRGSLLLDCDAKTGPFTWKVIARGDQEIKTDYLSRLEDDIKTGKNSFGQVGGQGRGDEIMDLYNQGEFREYYVEFEPITRVKLRLGRQQVVWGETDFFRAMDVVHGFDYRWRFFLEPENEEVRKPLIMANAMIQAPELNGSLQLIFRPGPLNRPSWTGNTVPIEGGRWNPQPYKGMDIRAAGAYDYDHPDGDTDDNTWGVRWSGIAGPVNYTLAYLETFNNDPVGNSGIKENSYEKESIGLAYDLIYPKVDIIGFTASGYVPFLDAVLSTEISYTFDEAFNVGTDYNGGPELLGKVVSMGLDTLGGVGSAGAVAAQITGGETPEQLRGLLNQLRAGSGPGADPLINLVDRVLIPQGLTAMQLKVLLGDVLGPVYDAYGGGDPSLLALAQALGGLASFSAPGLGGITKKDGLTTMLRMDKNLAFTQRLLGTSKPSFFSVQVFNHTIMNYDREDDIVYFLTFGEGQKKNETMITAIFGLNYLNDRINPMLAGGWDVSYGGFFAIPSVEFAYGDHWRLRVEADLFFPSGQKDPGGSYLNLRALEGMAPLGWQNIELGNMGGLNNTTSFLGYFANNDQILMRLTYQF